MKTQKFTKQAVELGEEIVQNYKMFGELLPFCFVIDFLAGWQFTWFSFYLTICFGFLFLFRQAFVPAYYEDHAESKFNAALYPVLAIVLWPPVPDSKAGKTYILNVVLTCISPYCATAGCWEKRFVTFWRQPHMTWTYKSWCPATTSVGWSSPRNNVCIGVNKVSLQNFCSFQWPS